VAKVTIIGVHGHQLMELFTNIVKLAGNCEPRHILKEKKMPKELIQIKNFKKNSSYMTDVLNVIENGKTYRFQKDRHNTRSQKII